MTNDAKHDPPFRAEHIGSLLRPPELIQGHRDFTSGKISADEFHVVQDQCIRDAVRMQEEAGLQSITDGEFRRASYFNHFIKALDGMVEKHSLFTFSDSSGKRFEWGAPHVSGKLRRRSGISTGDFLFLKGVTKQTPKVTMPSPSTMHFFRGRQGVDPAAYPDEEEFFEDLVGIYRDELADLARLGSRYVQIDEVPLAMLCDPNVRTSVTDRGENPGQLEEKYFTLINAILKDRPAGLTVGLHLCRGNYKAKWLASGGYDAIADRLFNSVDVDAYFLEYDTPRAGDFAPLKYLPSNKVVVLGIMSSKRPELESSDALKKRVDDASRFVPLERLAISPQCGFATSVGSVPMTKEDQIKKLVRLVTTAREIWG